MSLSYTDSFYRLSGRVAYVAEDVHWADLKKIDRAYGSLFRLHRESEIWNAFIRRARWVLWDLTDTPLPTDHPRLGLAKAGEELQQLSETLRPQVDPEEYALAWQVAIALQHLAAESLDLLGERCRDLLRGTHIQRCRLVVRRPRYRGDIEQRFREEGCPIQVIVEHQVRTVDIMERLVMTGPVKLYGQYVFNAPRAEKIHAVRYEWLSTRDVSVKDAARLFPPMEKAGATRGSRVSHLGAGDYLAPTIDWQGIRQQAEDRAGIDKERTRGDLEVEARLHLLGGGYGVYLSDERTVYTLNLGDQSRIDQVRVRDIGIGTAIVLRREGGGKDFIADVADAVMGEAAVKLRTAQKRWKTALRETVWELGGAPNTEHALRKLGTHARNVRYWMSPENIRTQSRDDFRILMNLIGIEEADILWQQMGRIDSAHRKAGARIRDMLLKEVRNADLNTLEGDGFMDFELPTEGAGTLTVFRVEGKAPDKELVSARLLRDPLPVGRDLWLS